MKDKILAELKRLESGDILDRHLGICHQVWNRVSFSHSVEEILNEHFRTWPHFNGLDHNPIGDWLEPGDKWDETTDNGALRWDLLRHCIRELENNTPRPFPKYTGPGSDEFSCLHCDDQPGGCVFCYTSC